LESAAADFKSKSYSSFGTDLGNLATELTKIGCKSYVCQIVQGLLNSADVAFANLEACEADLSAAETSFEAGSSAWASDDYGTAMKHWGSALNTVSRAITSDCGVTDELANFQHEAQLLGFGNISGVGKIVTIVVHGADFYEDLYAALTSMEKHDYRGAGSSMGKVLDELSEWTKGHACTNDFCYIVEGVLQFMGALEGDMRECVNDFEEAYHNFTEAFDDFSDSHHSIFHWHHNKDQIKAGLKATGNGFNLIAKGVKDCHMQEVAQILEDLAVKLGIAPEISIIEEILKILIEGVEIEHEIGDACSDWADQNWVGFGYNLARLIKQLL